MNGGIRSESDLLNTQFAHVVPLGKSMRSSSQVEVFVLEPCRSFSPALLRAVPVQHRWYSVTELLHLSTRMPGFAFRHQWFIAHLIYFSKAVASVSANPAPLGLLRLAAPTEAEHSFLFGHRLPDVGYF